MYTIHLRSIGIWIRRAICRLPAPSMRAASMTSRGMLFSAPYITTIQPPAPVQNAIIANKMARWLGSMTWPKVP